MPKFSAVQLDKVAIENLIPHAGNMVLLDSADCINASGLQCYSYTHLETTNPLRSEQGLSALSGIEYAAQAMALHISLVNAAARSQSGFLAICKNIKLNRRYLDAIDTELKIEVHHLSGSIEMGLLQYRFVITTNIESKNAAEKIISGELSIVVQ